MSHLADWWKMIDNPKSDSPVPILHCLPTRRGFFQRKHVLGWAPGDCWCGARQIDDERGPMICHHHGPDEDDLIFGEWIIFPVTKRTMRRLRWWGRWIGWRPAI